MGRIIGRGADAMHAGSLAALESTRGLRDDALLRDDNIVGFGMTGAELVRSTPDPSARWRERETFGMTHFKKDLDVEFVTPEMKRVRRAVRNGAGGVGTIHARSLRSLERTRDVRDDANQV